MLHDPLVGDPGQSPGPWPSGWRVCTFPAETGWVSVLPGRLPLFLRSQLKKKVPQFSFGVTGLSAMGVHHTENES